MSTPPRPDNLQLAPLSPPPFPSLSSSLRAVLCVLVGLSWCACSHTCSVCACTVLYPWLRKAFHLSHPGRVPRLPSSASCAVCVHALACVLFASVLACACLVCARYGTRMGMRHHLRDCSNSLQYSCVVQPTGWNERVGSALACLHGPLQERERERERERENNGESRCKR